MEKDVRMPSIAGGERTVKLLRVFPHERGENLLEVILFDLCEAIREDTGLIADSLMRWCALEIEGKRKPGDLRVPYLDFLQAILKESGITHRK